MILVLAAAGAARASQATAKGSWSDWIGRLGHDDYAYPAWINDASRRCGCTLAGTRPVCRDEALGLVDWRRRPFSAVEFGDQSWTADET